MFTFCIVGFLFQKWDDAYGLLDSWSCGLRSRKKHLDHQGLRWLTSEAGPATLRRATRACGNRISLFICAPGNRLGEMRRLRHEGGERRSRSETCQHSLLGTTESNAANGCDGTRSKLEDQRKELHKSCARCLRSQLPLASSHSSSERTLARARAMAQSAAP
jgi:hypothetical protein